MSLSNKVLVLHGGLQCGQVLAKGQFKRYVRGMKGTMDFVFVDAPFVARHAADTPTSPETRSWWRWGDDVYGPEGTWGQEHIACDGIAESLAVIEQAWRASDCVGLIGFSQGAIMASLFCRRARERNLKVQFAVFMSGFVKPIPTEAASWYPGEGIVDVGPTLHVFGEGDGLIPPQRSRELAALYAHAELYGHSGKHCVPYSAEGAEPILRFLRSVAVSPVPQAAKTACASSQDETA